MNNDLSYLLVVAAFFAVSFGLVALCDRLRKGAGK